MTISLQSLKDYILNFSFKIASTSTCDDMEYSQLANTVDLWNEGGVYFSHDACRPENKQEFTGK